MVIRPPAERPAEFPLRLRDRQIVDAREAAPHQSLLSELPILVAVAAEPGAGVVVPLVGEAHRDAVAGARPQLPDEPVVELACPLALEERAHLRTACRELGAVPPLRVLGVDLHDPVGVAGVPGVLRHANLLCGGLDREGRNRGTRWHGTLLSLDRALARLPVVAHELVRPLWLA